MKFDVYGPYELLRDSTGNLIPKETLSNFTAQVQAVTKGSRSLGDACGCYVFAIKARRGSYPWYVGKTERRTFSQECLNSNNMLTFNSLLRSGQGKPWMYLLPCLTDGDSFKSPTKAKRKKTAYKPPTPIDWLETMLIRMALERNGELVNTSKTKMLREIQVAGFFNSDIRGKRKGSVTELRKTFGSNPKSS